MLFMLRRLMLCHHIPGQCAPLSPVDKLKHALVETVTSPEYIQAGIERARQRQAERRAQAALRAAQREELQAARRRAIENRPVAPDFIQLEVIREERK